ncbi:MAG TPA: carboxypeptidase-like regulatory domain-containing protein [Flavobacteriales bacterium]|nr:carboxypeptidase-like regulatory domain-containing protein [Flavobacteriales bacterium]
MSKKYIIILLFLPLFAFTQKKVVISGTIYEKGSQELLPGVSIYCVNQKIGTSTNNYGYYSLTLDAGVVEMVVAAGGFNRFSFSKNITKDTTMDVFLDPENVLGEVVIVAEEQEKISEKTDVSRIDVPIEQIKKIPALLGEKDVLKVIQLLPGVQKGSEGSSGLYVRGGGPDQNLILLDDAPVYNAYHLFGFFSLFNGDALKSVELVKGGFPARYGGRLSSVLEMQMKDGNKEKLSGEAGIGLISSRLTLEGPIKKGKSSFLVSARRTYIDALIYPFLPADEKAGYYFYDANAKLNFNLDAKNRIFISGYFGKDKFYVNYKETDFREKANLNWGNATATFRWNHIFSNKIFANTSVIFTNYKLGISYRSTELDDNTFFELDYRSGIRDAGVKYDVDIFANANHHIKTGLAGTWHYFTPSATVISSSFAEDNAMDVKTISTAENGIYIEDDWRISPRIKANFGFRMSHFYAEKKHYFFPEPRAAMRFSINDELSVKLGYSIMHQYLHLLSNTGLGLPTDLWVPATDRTKPLESHQLVAGIAKDFSNKGFTLTVEGYRKNMNNVLGYKEGASFLFIGEEDDGFDWQNNVTAGKGESYGAEILFQKKKGKWNGWIGYTLSWTILQFDSLNFGKPFYAKYDRRHDASIVVMYQLNDHISLSATWVFGTGNAVTLPKAEYMALPHGISQTVGSGYNYSYYVSDYGEKNSFRMAPYHRGDVGVQFTKKKTNRERIFEFSVYNVYNRKNPFYYYIGQSEKNPNKRVLKQVSLFPIIPSVSWTVKF